MAAKIKLQRKGAKNKPFYRIIVQDESEARNGGAIEILGQYDPLKEPVVFTVDREKTLAWIAKGAMPTEKVRILLGKAGLLPPVDLAALHKRKPKKEVAEAAKPAAPAPGGPPAAVTPSEKEGGDPAPEKA
ncbi:30S ribosomal protein S16 [Candidatus Saganbacteria bacterium CG08_land_8_20_14_0_20_45_16]|uniref:Small ribosomal subunit protein bS16 n=1 Tax=Candidatus Saganbacteria bacterium CG08_land_8_20_14_0_20_45_16 TaxID=2014293 RepID=A0A2H0XYY9_UNCSA|nr:MAG: 30S ribosomal protein S16 [Candidatus Saganbacteria bacterium CG08_land_8_20_14_0_20_45_16]